MGAKTPVAAAGAQYRGQIALPADAHTKRAVHKQLQFHLGAAANLLDLGGSHLSGNDRSAKAHFLQRLKPGRRGNAALGGGVQMHTRVHSCQRGSQSQVLHDKSVYPGVQRVTGSRNGTGQLAVADQGI